MITRQTALLISLTVVLHGAVVLTLTLAGGLHYFTEYYIKTLKFDGPTGRDTLDFCDGPSTKDIKDITIRGTTPRSHVRRLAREHGAAIFEDPILTQETARQFRKYVVDTNTILQSQKKSKQVYVHMPENRINFRPHIHDDPSVMQVMREVASHEKLKQLLEDLMGSGTTLVNFSVLTAKYGALDQTPHSDTTASIVTQPGVFVPEYSVVIGLQETTKEMGATHICPGTQFCKDLVENEADIKDRDEEAEIEFMHEVCPVYATLKEGGGFMYTSDLFHRGAAHQDPDAEDRSYIFFIFSGVPQAADDNRMMPFGEVRALHWDMWGHSIDDMATPEKWKWWQAIGFFNNQRKYQNNSSIDANRNFVVKPWTIFAELEQMFITGEKEMYIFSAEGFDDGNLRDYTYRFVFFSFFAAAGYMLAVLPVMVFFIWLSHNNANAPLEEQVQPPESKKTKSM